MRFDQSTAAFVRDVTTQQRRQQQQKRRPNASAYVNFTRPSHDPPAYMHHLRQSVGPGDYVSQTPMPHCDDCFASDPRQRLAKSGGAICTDVPLVDVDSELRGYTYRASKYPLDKFLPEGLPDNRKAFCDLKAATPCRDENMVSEDTRLSNPPINLRGIENGFNRWQWLHRDPQERVQEPFDVAVDSRLMAKDYHRPHVPRPVDPTLALPPYKYDDRPLHDLESSLSRCRRSHDPTTASDGGADRVAC